MNYHVTLALTCDLKRVASPADSGALAVYEYGGTVRQRNDESMG